MSTLSSTNWIRKNERETLREVGQQIARKRDYEKLSQRELAAKVGTTQTSIRRMEKGQTNTSVVILLRTFRALDMNPADHLDGIRTREELIEEAYKRNEKYITQSTSAMGLRELDTATKCTLMEMLDIWDE